MDSIPPSPETSSSYTNYLTKKSSAQRTYLRDFFLGYKCLKIDRGHKYPPIKLKSVSSLLSKNDNDRTYYKYGALNLTEDPYALCKFIDAQIIDKKDTLMPMCHAARSIKINGNILISELIETCHVREVLLIQLAVTVLPQELLDRIRTKAFYRVSMVSLGLYILENVNDSDARD